jgi:hypothetical protein
MSDQELHRCEPPMEDRPKTEPTEWACPKCGRMWMIEVIGSAYSFNPGGGGEHVTNARWVPR